MPRGERLFASLYRLISTSPGLYDTATPETETSEEHARTAPQTGRDVNWSGIDSATVLVRKPENLRYSITPERQ
jgi:hypothetical protein